MPSAPLVGFEHVEILGHHQLFAQRLAQVVVVVDKQDLPQFGHGVLHCLL
jgi:hypothetical protein